MAVISSNGTGGGNWSLITTWAGGVLPDNTLDDVIIVDGDTVYINSGDQCKSLTVQSGGTYDGQGNPLQINGENGAGYAVDIDGTINDTDTDLDIRTAGTTLVDLVPSSGTIRDLTINDDEAIVRNVGSPTISGDLTVTDGTFKNNTGTDNLTVTGDVLISDGGRLEGENNIGTSQFNTFGSLTIASGGTYWATSGTTTITGVRAGGGNMMWDNQGGTFTHNKGVVTFTDNDNSNVNENAFYDLDVNMSSASYDFQWNDVSGGALKIYNNLTITRGDFEPSTAGDTLDIYGITLIKADGEFNADKNQTGIITHHGGIVLEGGTYHVEDGATVNTSGIRNVGGTIS